MKTPGFLGAFIIILFEKCKRERTDNMKTSAKCLDKERSMIKGQRMTGSCFRVAERAISKKQTLSRRKLKRGSGKES